MRQRELRDLDLCPAGEPARSGIGVRRRRFVVSTDELLLVVACPCRPLGWRGTSTRPREGQDPLQGTAPRGCGIVRLTEDWTATRAAGRWCRVALQRSLQPCLLATRAVIRCGELALLRCGREYVSQAQKSMRE